MWHQNPGNDVASKELRVVFVGDAECFVQRMITFKRRLNFANGSQRQVTFRRMDFHVELMGAEWLLFSRYQVQLAATSRFISIVAHVAATRTLVIIVLVTREAVSFQEVVVTVAWKCGEETF